MKMIYNTKNILSQEFQRYLELRLIEVMMMKMLPIQFGLILNWIQM
jgi:hypothetical protein